MSRVTVYSNTGYYLAELDVATTRTWVQNDIGTCVFAIAQSDAKCTESLLQYGNLVLVEHSTLPDWVGVIDVEREWHAGRVIQKVSSGERILGLRAMPMQTISGAAGYLFTQMLGFANASGGLRVYKGDVDAGGTVMKMELSVSLLEHVRQLAGMSPHQFSVTPYLYASGLLTLRANWYRHSKKNVFTIREGHNSPLELSSPIMVEQGEFWTEVIGYSDSATGDSRITSGPIRDEEAFSLYNLRQTNVTFTGVKDKATLIEMTKNYLKRNAAPRAVVTLKLADVLDASGNSIYFEKLRLGTIFTIELNSAGFRQQGIGYSETFRITGMSYSDLENKVELTVEVYDAG